MMRGNEQTHVLLALTREFGAAPLAVPAIAYQSGSIGGRCDRTRIRKLKSASKFGAIAGGRVCRTSELLLVDRNGSRTPEFARKSGMMQELG